MTGRLHLSAGLSRNPLTEPVLAGEVAVEGVELVCSAVHPSELFWRQLQHRHWDVSEMSLSSLLIARSRGNDDWVGVPVFSTRGMFHTRTLVRTDAGIHGPADLHGKRLGVPEYQQTAAVWARGVLHHEFGVRPEDVRWSMERPPERSHGGATDFSAPPGVSIDLVPPGDDLGEMVVRGDLDGVLLYLPDRNLVDRSRRSLREDPHVVPLFPDPAAEAARYREKTGLLHLNHCLVVRRTVAERHPWVPLNLYAAFLAARELALGRFASLAGAIERQGVALGAGPPGRAGAAAAGAFPYGIAANRAALATLAEYQFEQGLVARPVDVADVFGHDTLAL